MNSINQITTTDNNIISIKDLIKEVASIIPIKIRLSGNFYNSPFINFPHRQFRNILMEIFSNVYNHSQDKIVTIRIQDTKEHLIFKV